MENEAAELKKKGKDEVLLAALQLFSQKGYFSTSLADIQALSGVKTTRTIYQHFPNKQAIAKELYINVLDSLNISIDEIKRRNRSPSDQLKEIVGLLFKLADEAPDVMRFLLFLNFNEVLPDEKNLINTPPYTKIIKIFQRASTQGEISEANPLFAFASFFGIVNQYLVMALKGDLENQAGFYQQKVWNKAWKTLI